MDSLELSTQLADIIGFKKQFLPKLSKLGIKTVRDLLKHFPSRYEDWSEISTIDELSDGDEKTVQGIIEKIDTKRIFKRHMTITEALISDDSGSICAVWFNQPYLAKSLTEGKLVSIAGKVTFKKSKSKTPSTELQFSNPTYEIVPKDAHLKHTAGLIPVYPETRGLTSRGIRYVLQPILEEILPIEEFIPEEILGELELPEINDALRKIHTPEKLEDAMNARERFAFQDLFLLQLKNEEEKQMLRMQKAYSIKYTKADLEDILSNVPFELTKSQNKSLKEILDDISKENPMNRLLQGDVGSGKTIVVGVCALIASSSPNNLQSAFMAPTEILARQHYKTLTELFGYYAHGIGLITGKEARVFYGDGLESKITKAQFIKDISSGKIRIVIGTHALIQKNIEFKNLGLVVVDEQHRFGVRQRAELIKSTDIYPHFLSMSATPIPRTLTMTIFGNLDLSLITELPKGRKKIITKIVDPENRGKAYAFIRGEVQKERQVYVVCPRIDTSKEKEQENKTPWDDIRAVKEEYKKLTENIFPNFHIGILHGKLKSVEKAEVMESFKKRQLDIIVTTSVIEVGVDVPNATVMMIEGADRFGLSQLYQFRGRVGRGEHQSYCLLFTDSHSDTTHKRLTALITAKNGFELAEKDLEIRGPGEFLGDNQTGLPDIAMTAIQNPELLSSARKYSSKLFKDDPELSKHPKIKDRLEMFTDEVHME